MTGYTEDALVEQLTIGQAIEELIRDLLLPRLISGAVDVSELDIPVPEEAGAL